MAAPRHAQRLTTDSFNSAVAVDVSAADVILTDPCRGFYVGAGGAVACRLTADSGASGTDVTFAGMTTGKVYWIRVAIFRHTGTVATGIVALY